MLTRAVLLASTRSPVLLAFKNWYILNLIHIKPKHTVSDISHNFPSIFVHAFSLSTHNGVSNLKTMHSRKKYGSV